MATLPATGDQGRGDSERDQLASLADDPESAPVIDAHREPPPTATSRALLPRQSQRSNSYLTWSPSRSRTDRSGSVMYRREWPERSVNVTAAETLYGRAPSHLRWPHVCATSWMA